MYHMTTYRDFTEIIGLILSILDIKLLDRSLNIRINKENNLNLAFKVDKNN